MFVNQLFELYNANGITVIYAASDSILIPTFKLPLLASIICDKIGDVKVAACGFPIIVSRGFYYSNKDHYRSDNIKHSDIEPGVKGFCNNHLKAKCRRIMRNSSVSH
jgi:hypothetical protein